MLPKLKEIEKIAKAEHKKPPKINKYVDGVSDLEVYIANKLLMNQSTQQIIQQINKASKNQHEDRKIMNENYLRMTARTFNASA